MPTKVQRAEHLPTAELFIFEMVEIFFKVLTPSIVKTAVELIRVKRVDYYILKFIKILITMYHQILINLTQLCSNHCSLPSSLTLNVTVPKTCVDFKIHQKVPQVID